MDIPSTLALVTGAQAGDLVAREELFVRYLPRVRAIVALKLGRRLADLHDDEDLVQEALLSALKGLGSFQRLSDGTFYDWISTIVVNRIRDEWRRSTAGKRDAARVVSLPSPSDSSVPTSLSVPDPSPSPSERAAGAELSAQLEAALLELDERQREALVLREFCGMSYEEVGERYAIGTSSARSLVTRAKAALAEKLS